MAFSWSNIKRGNLLLSSIINELVENLEVVRSARNDNSYSEIYSVNSGEYIEGKLTELRNGTNKLVNYQGSSLFQFTSTPSKLKKKLSC